jgi:hypothetical protein
MVTKDRTSLKSLFQTKTVPTDKDFAALIDSMLNKREDQFFGKWRAGMGFQVGDVVLHNDRLYVFAGKNNSAVQAGAAQNSDCNCDEDDCCGNTPPGPPCNCSCWQEMRLDVNDHDWEIIYDGAHPANEIGMYARVYGRVGIGTKASEVPAAFLHLNDDTGNGSASQFLFNPTDAEAPTFRITAAPFLSGENCDDVVELNAGFLAQSLADETAQFATNTLGFLFRRFPRPDDLPAGNLSGHSEPEALLMSPSEPLSLLFVTSRHNRPRVGIGTEQPSAMLDMTDGKHGQILVNPVEKYDPELILINLDPGCEQNYLAQSVGLRHAIFTTDAPGGFQFRKGIEYQDFITKTHDADCGDPLVVFDARTGNVGIGTAHPRTRLEVRQTGGIVQASLEGDNPSMNIINTRPTADPETNSLAPNFLAVGVNNESAVFTTDSKNGFLFRQGVDINSPDDDIDIELGSDILRLQPENSGKGIFNAFMDGNVVAKGFYVEAAPKQKHEEINGQRAHELLEKLSLQRYRYDDRKEWQYGFLASKVEESFRDAVKTLPDNSKVIAYQNLVGALVAAVRDLELRVRDLEKHHHR